MNPAKYDSLPPDLKKVIDANTGLEWSKQIGKVFDGTTVGAKKLAADAGGVFETLTPAEYDRWVKATEAVDKEWVSETTAKGGNGAALLEDAKAMIKKNGG
jgi:TRAP-type C4-dicarboxylate transport system substrate-binding protein